MTPLETPNRLTPASLAAGAAIAYELHALDHLEPGLTPSGLRTPPSFLCTSPQPKMSPGTPGKPTPVTRRRGNPVPATYAAVPAREQIRSTGSETNAPDQIQIQSNTSRQILI